MDAQQLEEELEAVFQDARGNMGYPPVDHIELEEGGGGGGTAAIDLTDHSGTVMVDPGFARDLRSYDRKQGGTDEAVRGVFEHELGHYTYHPYDAATLLKEMAWVQEYDNSHAIRNYFDDVIDNLSLIVNGKVEDRQGNAQGIAHTYQAMGQQRQSNVVDRVLRKYYEDISQQDFGTPYASGEAPGDPTERELLQELKKIDFLNEDRLEWNLKRFADTFAPYIEDDPDMGGDHDISDYSDDDIEKGMKKAAKDLDPEDYRDLAEEVEKELGGDEDEDGDDEGIGQGRGMLRRLKDPDISRYEALARNYRMKIKGKTRRSGGTYPAELTEFEMGDPLSAYDPVNSYGRMMPGFSKKWEQETQNTWGEEAGAPDALIMIDSSGSMTDPVHTTSHAVLGGFVAANSYLENRSEVAVVNFSDAPMEQDFTRSRDDIYETLAAYQGGGTHLDVNTVKEYEQQRDDLHSIIITDAGIHNLAQMVDYFERVDRKRTLIHIGGGYAGKYEELSRVDDMAAYQVESESDIPHIVLGEID